MNFMAFWNMELFGENSNAVVDPFGGNTIRLTVPDSAGQSISGKVGDAVRLDPSSALVYQSNPSVGNGFYVPGNESFYAWFWVRRPSSYTVLGFIMECVNDSGLEFAFTWDFNDDLSFYTAVTNPATASVLSDNEYHLVVGYYNGSTDEGNLYVDEVLVNTASGFGIPTEGDNSKISFGAKVDQSDSYDGSFDIDAVGICLGDLSEPILGEIANGGAGKEFDPPGTLKTIPSPSMM